MIFVTLTFADPAQGAAAIVVQGTGYDITDGTLAGGFTKIVQKLRTPGVNSFRARELDSIAPPLGLLITEPLPTPQTFAQREDDYQRMIGGQVTLAILESGTTRTWKRVLVDDIAIVLRGGTLFGNGALAGSTRTLQTKWMFSRQSIAVKP